MFINSNHLVAVFVLLQISSIDLSGDEAGM